MEVILLNTDDFLTVMDQLQEAYNKNEEDDEIECK